MKAPIFLGILSSLCIAQSMAADLGHRPPAGHDTVDFHSRCRFVKGTDPLARTRPVIVAIPGGPGLSSNTMISLDGLADHYDVCLLDPPGTGGTTALADPSFEALLSDIEKSLNSLHRKTVLIGHSFGGILAGEIAVRKKVPVDSLVILGSPISDTSLDKVEKSAQVWEKGNPTIQSAKLKFEAHPEVPENLVGYLKAAAAHYFRPASQAAGAKMLVEDKVDGRLFQAYEEAKLPLKDLPERIKALTIPKIMLAGSDDKICELASLKEDALRANLHVEEIAGTGHFFHFEEPEKVNKIILDFLGK